MARVMLGTRVPEELMDRVADAVIWRRRNDDHNDNKTRFVIEALEAFLLRLYDEHNGGNPFPETDRQLGIGGRPKKEIKDDQRNTSSGVDTGKRQAAPVAPKRRRRTKPADPPAGRPRGKLRRGRQRRG